MWGEHFRRVAAGEISRNEGGIIHIDESIDRKIRKEVDTFLNCAVRTIKQGMQSLAAELHVNIGFMFKAQSAYENGIQAMSLADPPLAEYLKQTRNWSETLIQRRNAIEHEGWMLPQVIYRDTGNGIVAIEPQIDGQPVTQFVKFMFDRLCCFVEEFTAHALQRQMPMEITITETPPDRRPMEAPERFVITLGVGGRPRWEIAYHSASFEGI